MHLVKIVIPLYREQLTPAEEASLRQTGRVLARYPIEAVIPEGMNLPSVVKQLGFSVRRVSDEWLGSRNGIAGYNRMMLSREFYEYYADTTYILVCHPDAWVFRDELADWCRRGYDCVAAPWVRRPVYDLPLVRQYLEALAWWRKRQGRFCRQQLYGRVGNGGLSLRRVEAFVEACERHAGRAALYLSRQGHEWNEDVFFSIECQTFNVPSLSEAIRFAFDRHPAYCYRLTGRQLPFGCHGWSKPRMFRFWRHIIPLPAKA